MVVGACFCFCSAAKPANDLALASDALRTQSAVREAALDSGLQSAEHSIKQNITHVFSKDGGIDCVLPEIVERREHLIGVAPG